MYAKLKGKIIDVFPEFVIIDVNGIGFRVETVKSGYIEMQEVELYVYTHVREQDIRLFGFETRQEYLLFMDLIEISGIGPKSALILLSELSVDQVLNAINEKDESSLKVKGVGKKSAQRIIIEMASKIDKYNWDSTLAQTSGDKQFISEAKEALKDFGFDKKEIDKIIKDYYDNNGEERLEDLVKYALKYISRVNNK